MHWQELADEKATAQLAREIAALLQPVDCLSLKGPLGAGKTTFMQSLLSALGFHGRVTSPTFLLMQDYPLHVHGRPTTLWHLDAYRFKHAEEARELGLEELAQDAILCVEWPERCEAFLPEDRLELKLDYHTEKGESARRFMLQGRAKAAARVEGFHLLPSGDADAGT